MADYAGDFIKVEEPKPEADKPKAEGRTDQEILDEARERYDYCISAHSAGRVLQKDDAKFFAGSPDNGWQWPEQLWKDRKAKGRPALTINKQRQHVRAITNEQRQNRPQGKVLPVDSKSDPEVAQMLNGLVRHVEYQSDADTAYDTACESQVVMGEGYWRLRTGYIEGTQDLDIFLDRVAKTHSVNLDPDLKDPAGADARYGFVDEEIDEDIFKAENPGAQPINWDSDGKDFPNWFSNGAKKVRIAEYFYIEKDAEGNKVVRWCKLTGKQILSRTDWPGKWIPIVLVEGNADWIEGVCHRSGLVRNTKDSQRMFNYWASAEAEFGALQSKAPNVGAVGQFETDKNWKNANVDNIAYLQYDPVTDSSGRILPPPQRQAPPIASSLILEAKRGASDDIKAETGQYDPSLGNNSRGQSGIALQREQKKTEIANFHYIDNLSRSIRHSTRQIVDLINSGKIYTAARIARILGEDGEPDQVQIDPALEVPVAPIVNDQGKEIGKVFNPTLGTYDVTVTVGPSYTTQRQEAAQMLVDLSQGATDPVVQAAMRYLAVKNSDWSGAKELADVLKNLLPPGVVVDKKDAPEIPPEVTAQIKQAEQAMQEKGQQLQQIAEAQDAEQEKLDAGKDELQGVLSQIKDAQAKLELQMERFEAEKQHAKLEADLVKKDIALASKDLEKKHSDSKDVIEFADQNLATVSAATEGVMSAIVQMGEMLAQSISQSHQELARLITAPRQTELIMDAQGNPVSSVSRVVVDQQQAMH